MCYDSLSEKIAGLTENYKRMKHKNVIAIVYTVLRNTDQNFFIPNRFFPDLDYLS